jgi:hypothetical protein
MSKGTLSRVRLLTIKVFSFSFLFKEMIQITQVPVLTFIVSSGVESEAKLPQKGRFFYKMMLVLCYDRTKKGAYLLPRDNK